MNFDDRLRNHLNDQTNDIVLTSEGVDGVRTRSRRRKQRRAGVATLSIAAVAIAGTLMLVNPNNEQANLATEGVTADATASTETTAAPVAAADTTSVTTASALALPDPGSSLSLVPADTTNAPGGYNLFRSGRANGVYFVVSTAPGATFDEGSGEYPRADTLYTFNGSQWSQNQISDRFVSGFDSSTQGVIYAVSTGTPTSQGLAVGRSADGLDWDWTAIDLTTVFGNDQATWPAYAVQQAARGDERLVIVATSGTPDYQTAFALAQEAGANVNSAEELVDVNSEGISWFEPFELSPCQAAESQRANDLWDAEPEGPEFDYERDLTEDEQAELSAFWAAQTIRSEAIQREALDAASAVEGCDEYVACSTEVLNASSATDARVQDLLASFGIDPFGNADLSPEQMAALDAEYDASSRAQEQWVAESGCAEVLGWNVEGEGDPLNYASWADLGVTPPSSWIPAQYGFLVDGDVVTELGEVFDGQTGFLIDVDDVDGEWTATFETTNYASIEVDGPVAPEFVAWTSTDGSQWTSTPTNWEYQPAEQVLANGVGLAVTWTEEESLLFRRNADGSTNTLRLADLAPDLDTEAYSLARVATGEYGVVVTAVNWSQLDRGGNYSSIVLYSPDGTGWGATEVPDVEVVEAIVGSEDVVLFLNDPNREPGTPQPILLGK